LRRQVSAAWASSTLLLGVSILVFAVAYPPFNDAASIDPSLHMVEHVLIVLSGAMVTYSLLKKGALPKASGKGVVVGGFLAVSAILVFWHLPGPWDATVLNPVAHLSEHATLFAAGAILGVCIPAVSNVAKVLLITLAMIAHTVYASILTSGAVVYSVYTLPQQQYFGLFVFAMDPLFIGMIMWVIWRSDTGGPLRILIRRSWVPRAASLVLAVILVSQVSGFYIASAAADAASAPPAGTEALVVIQETPVSWQYSPQNLTVVVGVNSTVTWLSHSLTYDTATANGGAFSSGVLAPGDSFSFTFSSPGTYQYHCLFHPWMTGTVTVFPDERGS
jgi:plastocyanin